MSYLQELLGELSFEGMKPANYEMQLEDYFKPDAELASHLDAVEVLGAQIDAAESVIARFEHGGIKMNTAALAITTALAAHAAPSVFGGGFGDTLSSEENGVGELVLSTESMKDRLKGAKNKAADLITKAINFVMDYYRKFKTGTDKLVKMLEEAKGKAKDVDIKEAKPSLFIGDKVASESGVKSMSQEVLKYGSVLRSGEASIMGELMMLGAKKVTFYGKDNKFVMKIEDAKPTAKDVKMSKADVEGLLGALSDAAKSIGKIDHKAVTAAIQKKVEEERGKEDGGDVAYYAKALRGLTVKLPSMAASGMAKVPGALGL